MGVIDQSVKLGDGNWKIDGIFPEMPSIFSRELARDNFYSKLINIIY